MSSRFGVRALIITIGFTAAVAQIVLMRELMVVFYGNEITIGLMLASWLLWTAAGSAFGGIFKARSPRYLTAAIQVLLAAALPATVLAVRAAKSMLQTVPGEILGPGAVVVTSLAVLAPLCTFAGALFPAASRIYASGPDVSAGEAMGSVYLWEAIGSAGGGLAAGLVLVRLFGSLEIAWWIAVVNLMVACAVAMRPRAPRYVAIGLVGGFAILLAAAGTQRRAELASQERFWRGQHLIATRNSVYGNLAVVGTDTSRTVYENGVVLFTSPDPASAEEAIHYALLEHPSPRTLLLIGGGLNGSIREALRHASLERVDYVELDPAILELARDYFPAEERALRADSRVHVHIADGRLFLKNTAATFDVVIVNLPDPRNAQLNRFYTAEFFQEVAHKLTDNGVLALQLRGSENYIGPELGAFLGSIHQTLQSVFPAVQAIPGETVHFFAARRTGVLASGAEELLTRLRARNLHTSYVSEYFIPYRMAPDRTLDLEKQFRRSPVNHDFAPIAYYLDVALWTSQFHPVSQGPLSWLAGIPYSKLASALGIALAAMVVAVRLAVRPRQRQIVAAGCCTAAAGFNMIGTEMILLLGFQAVYGYVYQQLAVLIAAFMAGVALGSWLAQRRPTPARMMSLGIAQLLIAAAPLALAGLIASMPASAAVFSLAALACGMLGGFEFPLACGIYFGGAKAAGTKRLGTLYALDLAGSSVGAIAVSAWLIPIFGFLKTGWLAAMLGLAPALLALSTASGTDPAEGTNSRSAPLRTREP